MTLHIGTWWWGTKYGPDYVKRLRKGVERNVQRSHIWHVFSPQPEDKHLTQIQGCFCRLRMFDPNWQVANGIFPGDRVVCLDLDAIVTGQLDELFNPDAEFTILEGANASNPCRFNGSIWMFRGGTRHDVWEDFSVEAAGKLPFYQFPDDQGWFDHKFPDATGWKVGPSSGIYAFRKPGWPNGYNLPAGARLVVFPGHRDPSDFTHLSWVRKHWA